MKKIYFLKYVVLSLLLGFAFISQAQTFYNFNTPATIVPGAPWNTEANITINGVIYKLTCFGNGSFTNSSNNGSGNSASLQKDGSGGDSFTLARADGQPFQFYGFFVRMESITSYSTFPGLTIPPWYTVTYNKTVGAAETETDMTAVNTGFTYTTSAKTYSKNLTVTSVNIFFQANSRYWIDDIVVGIPVGTEVAPTVTTAGPTGVGSTTATLGGNVTADGGAAVSERGIVWATTANPTTASNKVTIGSGTGAFSTSVGSLPANTALNVRAYAINSEGTSYGGNIAFSTLPPTIAISPSLAPAAAVGAAYNQTFSGSGGTGPYTFSVTAGALPAGLSLNGTTGVLAGTPTAAGTFNFSITGIDASSFSGTRAYTLAVAFPVIAIAPSTLTSGLVGAAYNQAVTASGGIAPYSIVVTAGALPPGLSLSSAGILSGTPTGGGVYNFTLTGTGSSTGLGAPHTGSRAYALTINVPTIEISPTTLPNPAVGFPYNQNITATAGTAPYTYGITAGALPPGLSLSGAGILSGTPTGAGTYNFTIGCMDSSTGSGPYTRARAYTMTVGAPTILISPAVLPGAGVGVAYSQSITASGGIAPYSFAVTAGALPPGLSLNSVGILSGMPTAGGTYNFTITGMDSSTGSGPYSGARAFSMNINFLPQTISMAAVATADYGDADIDPGATSNSGLSISYSTSDPAIATIVAGKVHIVGAGTVTVFANQAGNGTWAAASQQMQTLTINKAQLTYTANTASKVYGTANPVFTGTVTGFKYADNLGNATTGAAVFTSTATSISPIGSYQLAGAGLSADNYTFIQAASNATAFTITTRPITVTASTSQSKVYGLVDPVLTYSITAGGPLIGTDAFTGTLARAVGENVGNYAINQGSLALNSNYSLSFISTDFAITPKAITVTPNAGQSKVYGSANPTLAYSITAGAPLVGADNFTGALSRATGENIGSYAITQGSLALSANYTLTVSPANFSITAKAITVTATPGQSKVYGTANPVLTYTITSGGPLVTGDAFTGVLSRTAGENVGAYAISQGTLALTPNYSISYVPSNFAISQAALTIRADNKERFFGGANPTLTASYVGFVNGETNAVLTTQPVLSTTANAASPIGDYPITISGAAAINYAITYVNGILKVKAGAPTNITLASTTLYENRAAGTSAGTLSSTSDDPSATFSYTLVAGTGDTDNGLFAIAGTSVSTNASLDFETKSSYSIRVKSTTQFGLSLEKVLTIALSDVNEIPTMAAVNNVSHCFTSTAQTVALSGISAGPETAQTTTISVSSNNAALFESLTATKTGTTGSVNYVVKNGASGVATVTVTIKDNGGTANGGVDTYTRTFTVTVNPLPIVAITSDKGSSISKGDIAHLTASGGTSYVWAANSSIITGQNTAVLTARPQVNTVYTVTATNATSCAQSLSFTLDVAEDYAKLNAKNILTPNNDGHNDKWIVDNIDFYPNNEVKVFDRAGRIVYSKKGYDNSWDGTFNGTQLNEDTYYYIVDFGTQRPKLKGYITLIKTK